MIGMRFGHHTHWVEVDLNAKPETWARATVRDRWAAQRLDGDPARIEAITASIARIVASLDAPTLKAALLLHPIPGEPVITVVGLRTVDAAPGLTLDALGDQLCVPEDMLETPRDRSLLETPAGAAVRLVQRYREPLAPGVEEIREHLAYGWLVADHAKGTVLTMSTVFVDLVAAGTWTAAVDELAKSLTTGT